MSPSKPEVIERVRAHIAQEIATIAGAARAAHDAATSEENKAENKYDTRAIEASYLAGAQARRAAELEDMLLRYQRLEARAFSDEDAVGLAALIELESADDGARSWYLLGPCAGGIKVESRGHQVTVITPGAPMGRALVGREVGDEITLESPAGKRWFEIKSVL